MSMVKWRRAKYQPCLPLGEHETRITGSNKHIQLSRKAATEGAVLLKNHASLLPLKKGTKLAVFGKAQIDYIKGGGGAGDTHVAYVRNIYQGLKLKEDYFELFDKLSLYYQEYVEAEYQKGSEPGMFDEAVISEELLQEAKEYTDTAVITICRYSTEAEDRKNDGTDTYFNLSKAEQNMVQMVTDNFANVIVLLNVGAIIDTSWFADNDRIASALVLWQGGMEGGLAAADLLCGDANPCGKLVDTCAKNFDDYPSSAEFHESDDYVKYTDDIFVGYRYFETIPDKKDCVVYPFGYGLSYTKFALADMNASCDGESIQVSVNVTNIGAFAGKEVVQVYYSAPKGRLEKPAIELGGFAKTGLLAPGESQALDITFSVQDMATYDDTGVLSKACYIMEQGTYRFFVGTDIRTLEELSYQYTLEDNIITRQCTTYCTPERLDRRLKADGSYEALECKKVKRAEFVCEYQMAAKPDVEKPYELLDVAEGKIDLDTFIAQLTDEELCGLVVGQPCLGVASTYGMGNVSRLGIPNVMTADGPAGVRLVPDRGINTTAFPVETALACTWDVELLEEIGSTIALELKENNICILLAPALNIHRSPLCGRNFEYFSEDPLVTGKMAAAMVKGIQGQNMVAVPKHLACNNKETNRYESDSIISEKALREIYLRGFEICVKEANPKMIMTAYNWINGVHASEFAEMLTGIVRNEWGYQGMFTSDWWNTANHVQEVKAGNDIKMPVTTVNMFEELQKGTISREEIAVCVKRILEMILWLE